ncbi:hypothetical protein Cgig2_000103 [Carnegiea gigantea]|uniref:Uncharacterized protein n=1 Tax=Carnegiea gigantea TaxID=171969 RepID=A0A9Q1L108_9CARY|nr:hypothetical protein Cgig2_000103 [Carnegiea gigantea]
MKAALEESSGAGSQEEDSEVEVEPEGKGSACEGATSPSDDDKQGRATRPPRPLPEDYHILCPRFSLPEVEGAAADFELPKMVQATFYAMLLNEAMELGVVHGFMTEGSRSALVGLRWSSFEHRAGGQVVRDHFRWSLRDPSDPGPRPLLLDHLGLYPRFDLGLEGNGRRLRQAEASRPADPLTNAVLAGGPSRGRTTSFPSFRDTAQAAEYVRDNLCWSFAHAAHVPEMVQAIFYAMVINDTAKLRLIRRETNEGLMLDLCKLRWDVIEAWLLSIKDKLKDAQVFGSGGDGV